MPNPYNNSNGYYTYGISEYDQPSIPYYNASIYHKGDIREFPCKAIKDDGEPYLEYVTPNCCLTCKKCNGINRNLLVNTFVNIQSYIDKILVLKLYGITKDLDKTVSLKKDHKYCITYITEKGLITTVGVFKELSENVPDECITYIGNFSSISSAAYIGLDCSTEGKSDKRLIYIGSIRDIKEVFGENDDPYYNMSQNEKIAQIHVDIESIIQSITQYIEDNSVSDEEENNQEGNSTPQTFPPPPPPEPHHYTGPYIIGARPPFFPPPPPPPPYILNNKEKETIDIQQILDKLDNIKLMLNSFITNYINTAENVDNESCNCDGDSDTNNGADNQNNNSDTNDQNNNSNTNNDTDNQNNNGG